MSVPADQRSEGKLLVAERAKGLASYTLQITKNPKVFTPEQADGFTDEIRKLATEIYINIWTANNIYVRTEAEAEERRSWQRRARQDCNRLLPLIDIAGKVFHLSKGRMKYWGEWVIEVRNRVQAWEDSDRKRNAERGVR